MAELTTLARPYAKAAFEHAHSRKELAAWSKMLALLAEVVQQNNVKKALANPALTASQQADILLGVCGEDLDEAAGNFVRTLAANKRLPLLTEIVGLFDALRAEVEKTLDVQVTSAFALDASATEKLKSALQKKFNCEIKVEGTVDSNLIGGVIVRAGDMIIDGSIRGRLTKLAEAMNS